MSIRVLIVDDEAEIREELIECLAGEGYDCVQAVNGEQGLEIIRGDSDVSIVLSDIQMPGRTGLEMIAAARAEFSQQRQLEFIVITGHGGTEQAISALKLGVMDFLQKPIDVDHAIHVVRRAEELVLLKKAKRNYEQALEADVEAKTVEIRGLFGNLQNAYAESLECLATAAEYKDPETGNHIRRIGEYARVIAAELGWSRQRQEMILLAGPLHDVGKIGTPDAVLLKPGRLSPDEVIIMKQHAEIGERILSRSNFPVMMVAARIAGGHHERWDGGGYPRGLAGNEIPIEARITSVVDVYDALRSERPYKPGFDQEKTLSIMLDGDGRTDPAHFDPELLEIFRIKAGEFAEIFARMGN